jgi:hypothetical protein
MSVEEPSSGRPDESVERQRTERQLADISELVLFLVGAFIPKLTAITTPLHITPLAMTVHDTIMAWATEALKDGGVQKERRADGEAVPVVDFERLVELGDQDAQVQAALDNARGMIESAAWQLWIAKPNSRAWYQARLMLDRAISRLLDASSRLMQLDAIRATATNPVQDPRQLAREAFLSAVDEASRPLDAEASSIAKPGRVGAETLARLYGLAATEDNRSAVNAEQTATAINLERLYERVHGGRRVLGRPEDPAPRQGGVAPTSPI